MGLQRFEKREDPMLFELPEKWDSYWWGMPEFTNGDASPVYTVTINFASQNAFDEFKRITGICTFPKNSSWYPVRKRLIPGQYYYNGPKTDSRYPICIPSKGRSKCQSTGRVLDKMGMSYKFFVEETEYQDYVDALGEQRVVKMPFHDLGQGSIPARNFIWDWAVSQGVKRHWTVDDNIRNFSRYNANIRICVWGGGFFRAMEDFVDRYSNISMAGPHDKGFIVDPSGVKAPVTWNSRIYSCILLDTTMSYRWRGKYNEDTDLSLRILKDGNCTCLFCALLMDKDTTSGAKGIAKPGGNTDNVYIDGDHRLAFAKSLQEQHPDCVKITWKFNRWHHQVDYSRFKDNKPLLLPKITPIDKIDNYGMTLYCDDVPEVSA